MWEVGFISTLYQFFFSPVSWPECSIACQKKNFKIYWSSIAKKIQSAVSRFRATNPVCSESSAPERKTNKQTKTKARLLYVIAVKLSRSDS